MVASSRSRVAATAFARARSASGRRQRAAEVVDDALDAIELVGSARVSLLGSESGMASGQPGDAGRQISRVDPGDDKRRDREHGGDLAR